MNFLSGVTVLCFFASYLVALALEVSRLFFRMPVRMVLLLGFAAAGLVAHTAYLIHRAMATQLPLSSWHDWYLIVAWLLAAAYLGLAWRRPQTNVGLFLLPVVVGLVGVAWRLPGDVLFARQSALALWGMAHGGMLLIGTVAVLLGFVAGVMYLFQSWRLKHRLPPQWGVRLPSLEWLQTANRRALVASSLSLALGLIAGIVLNAVQGAAGSTPLVPWTDHVVLGSAVLLAWLVAAMLFEWLYKPAQQGRKVAYLTVANFVFLAMVLAMLLSGKSAHPGPGGRSSLRVGSSAALVAAGLPPAAVLPVGHASKGGA
jgi:ABC-type transport system involved in cytochrome c biogenesis permease subunit